MDIFLRTGISQLVKTCEEILTEMKKNVTTYEFIFRPWLLNFPFLVSFNVRVEGKVFERLSLVQ